MTDTEKAQGLIGDLIGKPLTKPEISALQSLHLRGYLGRCGAKNKRDRLALLRGLIDRGYMTDNLIVTPKGIEESKPKYLQHG